MHMIPSQISVMNNRNNEVMLFKSHYHKIILQRVWFKMLKILGIKFRVTIVLTTESRLILMCCCR